MKTKTILLVIILLCGAVIAQTKSTAKEERAEKVRAVRSVFISGNNSNAQQVRGKMERDKHSCLTVALKADDADGVLDVAEADRQTGWASVTLTNHAGEMIWSYTNPDVFDVYDALMHAACVPAKKKK